MKTLAYALSLAVIAAPLVASSSVKAAESDRGPSGTTAAASEDSALRSAYRETDPAQRDVALRQALGDQRSPGWRLRALAEARNGNAEEGGQTFGCGVTQTFAAGIPANWNVINNAPGNPVSWAPLAGCGEGGNYTSGSGDLACASSDLQGGGSGLYDTELRTPSLNLPASDSITLSYGSNYQNFALVDFLDVDISTNGGASWTTLLSWNEDHPAGGLRLPPGEDVALDLTAYGGQSVILRWHYYDPTGPDTSQDWYAQIDDVALDCGPAAIEHDLTVGTDDSICAPDDYIAVAPGTDVYYCHRVVNTGGVLLSRHDLVNSEFGVILSGFPFNLFPGNSVFVDPQSYTESVTEDVVRTSEWTAYNPGPIDVASDQGLAGVFILGPEPLICGGRQVDFNAGIPTDWTIVNNAPGNPVVWAALQDCDEAGNYTRGAFGAACASSDLQGGGSGLYDTELRSPSFSLVGVAGTIELVFEANYQNFAGVDSLDVDISTNGGASWLNLLSWNEDHPAGGLRNPPGETAVVDISGFGGLNNLLLRWHYYDPTGPDTSQDWYAQLDNVRIRSDSCTLFADGFESGDTAAWSSTVP